MLSAKTIREKPSPDDGYRLLVARRWPAKFPASWADGFNPNLAPSDGLYEKLMKKEITRDEFEAEYSLELDAQKGRLRKLGKQAENFNITLVTLPDADGKSIGDIVVRKCGTL